MQTSAAHLGCVDDKFGNEEFDIEKVLGWTLHLVMQVRHPGWHFFGWHTL